MMVDERIKSELHFFLQPLFWTCIILFFFSIFKARIAYELNESKVKEDDDRVDRPMTKQLNIQGRPDPKGGLRWF
jgi:hypothetical protein